MSLKTKVQFWKLKKSFSPNTKFKRELASRLDSAWKVRYGKPAWYHTGWLYKVGAFAVVLLILAGGGGVYAYSSPTVTEGTPLYPVKKAIEKMEEISKVTPEAKAKFYLKTIARREAEQDELKKNDIKQTVQKFKRAKQVKVLEIKIEKTEKSLEQAEEQLERVSKIIENFDAQEVRLQPEIKTKIENRLQIRKERLERASEIIKERQEKLESRRDAGRGQETERVDEEDVRETQQQRFDEDRQEEDDGEMKIELRNRIEFSR